MPSLFASLGLARQSLSANQAGLDITQKNIANANTPGYTRLRLNQYPGTSADSIGYLPGSGNVLTSVDSYRNRFLDYRITSELQDKGKNEAAATALKQVEDILNENADQGLQNSLSEFFNSFEELANAPEDIARRQSVLSAAESLKDDLQRVYGSIQRIQIDQDQAVRDTVGEINSLTESIAELNVRIGQAEPKRPEDAEAFRDQRQRLLDELAGLIDISYFETESGAFTVATRNGQPLVNADQNHPLQAAVTGPGGFLRVSLEGVDITARVQSGKLGGLLQARDVTIAGYLADLDDLAAGLIERVNTVHAQGSDLFGVQGGDFFVPFVPAVPGSNSGAVRTMQVALVDPLRIAAAGLTGGKGDNANALVLTAIGDETLFSSGSLTATEFYSGLAYRIGDDSRRAEDNYETQRSVVTQLENQRDSASGVSLDEEAVNIIRFQKAYEANARFIRVVDELSDELMRILGG